MNRQSAERYAHGRVRCISQCVRAHLVRVTAIRPSVRPSTFRSHRCCRSFETLSDVMNLQMSSSFHLFIYLFFSFSLPTVVVVGIVSQKDGARSFPHTNSSLVARLLLLLFGSNETPKKTTKFENILSACLNLHLLGTPTCFY